MSKEKQIEELAEHMIEIQRSFNEYCAKPCRECELGGVVNCENHYKAEALYNAGYRKQSEGEWIRAENPPEEYRDECGELIPFLVCCQGTVYPFRAMYDGANWGDGIGVLKVTHWMPLPEPPKGD